MPLPRRNLVDYSLPEPAELAAEDLDVLSVLTMTVALFGLGLTSVVSLLGLLGGG